MEVTAPEENWTLSLSWYSGLCKGGFKVITVLVFMWTLKNVENIQLLITFGSLQCLITMNVFLSLNSHFPWQTNCHPENCTGLHNAL